MVHRLTLPLLTFLLLLGTAGCEPAAEPSSDDALRQHAQDLARRFIIADGHVDVPYRMTEREEDISQATEHGNFDYPRARQGGLDAPFMSIYIPAERQLFGRRYRKDPWREPAPRLVRGGTHGASPAGGVDL